MVGLGRMGANMTRRLIEHGHRVVAFDLSDAAVRAAEANGAMPASSLAAIAEMLAPPRAVWVMVPAGAATSETLETLGGVLDPGDALVDGGNTRYTDTAARAATLASDGIDLLDAGTSGGIWGLAEGYCLMIGGTEDAFARLEPIFESLAPAGGYAHVGPPGAGHFVKMVHNAIEYALMQGYAEGLELLRGSKFDLDVAQITELWRHGSVVRSWLLDLAARALHDDPELTNVVGYVEDSGEGRWTVEHAIENAVPLPAITLSLFARFASRRDDSFAAKVLAALRKEFGGHEVREHER